ncbi:hypothetical protein AVEN_91668-1 [Araneus ventricosus]|uniref:Uncharacterized protein n=1 Tax=Araneus ventricosus TaxID=182803 RepID=A0A4Y2IS99_ARAVE|nr:hypothetical protein AVEN_91668-1 [Araneus ventricosus]
MDTIYMTSQSCDNRNRLHLIARYLILCCDVTRGVVEPEGYSCIFTREINKIVKTSLKTARFLSPKLMHCFESVPALPTPLDDTSPWIPKLNWLSAFDVRQRAVIDYCYARLESTILLLVLKQH